MTAPLLSVFVPGIPRPAGSKRAFAFMHRGRLRATVADASGDNGKAWRSSIVGVVCEHWTAAPLDEPLRLDLEFVLPRPKDHYGKRKGERHLKSWAEIAEHVKAPDRSKLTRAVEDALKGVVYRDDCLIVAGETSKRFGDRPGVRIIVAALSAAHAAGRIDAAEAQMGVAQALLAVFDIADNEADVEDGREGPRPNYAMRVCGEIEKQLYRRGLTLDGVRALVAPRASVHDHART